MPRVRDPCKFCHQYDVAANLIAPCDCYKKSDTGRVHKKCLEKYIEDQERANDDPDIRCERCHKPYSVTYAHHFVWDIARLCSCQAIFNCVEFLIIIMLFSMFTFALYITGQIHEAGFVICLVLMALMVVVTLRRVYHRWKKEQSDTLIVDYV
eukprot:GFYU01028747.1.p1 GENE.GFYU01028747.1~~GFYU01028747.1.p1  ORF type:complete len:153 (-),score=23.34 GFYU01028747.1:84-542(-)